MRKTIFGIAALSVLYLVDTASVIACTCLKPGNWMQDAFDKAEVVFIGDVEIIGEAETKRYSYSAEGDYLGYSVGPDIQTTFRVTEIFKGESSPNTFRKEGSLFMQLFTGSGSTCDAPVNSGASLLVFGIRDSNGYLDTSLCTSERIDVPEHVQAAINRQIEVLREFRDTQSWPDTPLKEDPCSASNPPAPQATPPQLIVAAFKAESPEWLCVQAKLLDVLPRPEVLVRSRLVRIDADWMTRSDVPEQIYIEFFDDSACLAAKKHVRDGVGNNWTWRGACDPYGEQLVHIIKSSMGFVTVTLQLPKSNFGIKWLRNDTHVVWEVDRTKSYRLRSSD